MKIRNKLVKYNDFCNEYYEGRSLDECLIRMSIDLWMCSDKKGKTLTDLKNDENFSWEVVN